MEVSQNENTPNGHMNDIGHDAIIEQSVEETLKESASLLMEQNENIREQEENDFFFNQLKQQQQNHYSLTFHRDRRQTKQASGEL